VIATPRILRGPAHPITNRPAARPQEPRTLVGVLGTIEQFGGRADCVRRADAPGAEAARASSAASKFTDRDAQIRSRRAGSLPPRPPRADRNRAAAPQPPKLQPAESTCPRVGQHYLIGPAGERFAASASSVASLLATIARPLPARRGRTASSASSSIAESTLRDEADGSGRLHVLGEHEHPDFGVGVANPSRCADPFVAERRRHPDVDHCEVGCVFADRGTEAVGVVDRREHVMAGALEQQAGPMVPVRCGCPLQTRGFSGAGSFCDSPAFTASSRGFRHRMVTRAGLVLDLIS
jgi:hypothetical protein